MSFEFTVSDIIVAKNAYNHNIDAIMALTYACHRLGNPQPGELGGRLDYDQPC